MAIRLEKVFGGSAKTWVHRLKRVFKIDIETCDQCGGAVKVMACIEDPALVQRILDHFEHRGRFDQAMRPTNYR